MVKLSKILPLLAIVVGLAGSAFTVAQQNAEEAVQTDYFWYTPDGQQSLGIGPNPDNGCTSPLEGCAEGYEEEQPIPVPETSEPDVTRAFN